MDRHSLGFAILTSLVLLRSIGETREAFPATYTRFPVIYFIIKKFQEKTVFASLYQSLQSSDPQLLLVVTVREGTWTVSPKRLKPSV